jgi:hypothetical protein
MLFVTTVVSGSAPQAIPGVSIAPTAPTCTTMISAIIGTSTATNPSGKYLIFDFKIAYSNCILIKYTNK